MEASVAGNGGPDGAAEAAAAETTTPTVDLGPVLERLDGLDGRLGRVEPALEALAPAPEAEADPLAGLAELFGAEEPDPMDQAGMDGRALIQGLQAMQEQNSTATQQQVQEALAPVMQQLTEMSVRMDADALVEKFPDLKDREVFEPIVEEAQGLAQMLGNPNLSTSAKFIELVYLKNRAEKIAAGEVPAGQSNGFELETPGGAPGGDEPDMARRIVESRGGNVFWGT